MWSVGSVVLLILAIGFFFGLRTDRPVPGTATTPPVETRTPAAPQPSPGPASEPALPSPQR
jgi:hypothetical protein